MNRYRSGAVQSASVSSPSATPAPPSVRVVVPTHEVGPWFDDVVAGLEMQDYPSLAVTIVHSPGEAELFERHRSRLGEVTLIAADNAAGFGTKVNSAASVATEDLLLVLHDDAALAPGAIAALVREFLRRRDPRSIVAAKLLDWNDPKRLMPSGFEADRFGVTASLVRPGDFDQGQQERVSDLFGTSIACVLVSRSTFTGVGGFDEAMDFHGEAHELAVRFRAIGGSVVIASAATARHRGAFEQRSSIGPTFRERRHQMRSIFTSTSIRQLPMVLLGYFAIHVLELVVALARLDIAEAASIFDAWFWNLRKLGSLRARRTALLSREEYDPRSLVLVRQRGSIRLSESFDRRVVQREVAAETGEGAISPIRVAGGVTVATLLTFGARHLITRPIPIVGEFRQLPESFGTLTGDWFSGFRIWGLGSEGFASFALPLLDVVGALTFGAEGLLRTLLILLPLPLGVIGMWRLFSQSTARTAPAAAAAMYAASPLPYNALSNGSFTAMLLVGLMPWVVANMIAITQTKAFGSQRQRPAAIASLAAIMAVALAFEPFAAVLFGVVILGFVLGSLLSGDVRGVLAVLTGSLVALAIAAGVNLPHLLGLREWAMFGTAQTSGATDVPLTDLLTLATGPVGSLTWGVAALVTALLGLVSGKGLRFTWAMRFWGVLLVAWGFAWADERGVLPVGFPPSELVLVPVAVGIAALAGIAAMVIEIDLVEAKARRFFPAAVAVLGFLVAMVPLLDASSSGRWELAEADLTTTYGALDSDPADGSFRTIWIGDAHVLGAGAVPTANGLAWASSFDDVPDIRALWRGPNSGATAQLSEVISAGLDGRTSRLGRELAPFGVRFVVVVDQQAPVPEVSRREVVSDIRASSLNAQLDLVRTGVVNPAVTVFDNTAWAPVHSAVAPNDLDSRRMIDAQPALVDRVDHVEFEGQTRAERDVFASWQPTPRWVLTSDGNAVPRVDVGEVGIGFASSGSGALDATLRFETPDSHRIIVLLQVAAWVVLFSGRRWLIGRARRQERRVQASQERVG